jgi:hypothetical protein
MPDNNKGAQPAGSIQIFHSFGARLLSIGKSILLTYERIEELRRDNKELRDLVAQLATDVRSLQGQVKHAEETINLRIENAMLKYGSGTKPRLRSNPATISPPDRDDRSH